MGSVQWVEANLLIHWFIDWLITQAHWYPSQQSAKGVLWNGVSANIPRIQGFNQQIIKTTLCL